jgi:predicted DNA-binding antitoxin AbrB/MazE fold protein
MTIHCKAVHEKGVLRPEKPLELADGARVDLIVVPADGDDRTPHEAGLDARKAAAMLARIASMPMEVDDKGFSGRTHDKVLYGKKD